MAGCAPTGYRQGADDLHAISATGESNLRAGDRGLKRLEPQQARRDDESPSVYLTDVSRLVVIAALRAILASAVPNQICRVGRRRGPGLLG